MSEGPLNLNDAAPIKGSAKSAGAGGSLHLRAGLGTNRAAVVNLRAPGLSYSAASSPPSARPEGPLLTSRLTPLSTIVTPNSRCMRLIVTALWVTIR